MLRCDRRLPPFEFPVSTVIICYARHCAFPFSSFFLSLSPYKLNASINSSFFLSRSSCCSSETRNLNFSIVMSREDYDCNLTTRRRCALVSSAFWTEFLCSGSPLFFQLKISLLFLFNPLLSCFCMTYFCVMMHLSRLFGRNKNEKKIVTSKNCYITALYPVMQRHPYDLSLPLK